MRGSGCPLRSLLIAASLCMPCAAAAEPDPFFPGAKPQAAGAARYQLMGVMVYRQGARLALVRQRTSAEAEAGGDLWWLLRPGEQLPDTGWTLVAVDSGGVIFAGQANRYQYLYPGQELARAEQPPAGAGG